MNEEEPSNILDLKELLAEREPEVEKDDLNIIEIKPEEVPEEVSFPAPTPDIKTRIYTNYIFLKEFLNEDFNIEQPTLIDLKKEGFWFIVFIDETQAGREFLQRWLELAQIVKADYLNLGYCNLTFEKKIFDNFKSLNKVENIDHPFHWAKYLQTPFMMVYRNSWPVGFYTGDMNQQALVNYIIEDASNPLVELTKINKRRVNPYREANIIKNERNLREGFKEDDLREKAKKEDQKEKEKLKNIDSRSQEISHSVNFLD